MQQEFMKEAAQTYYNELRQLYPEVQVQPRLEWKNMGYCAGRAYYRFGKVVLNPQLLDFTFDDVLSTVAHEFAHHMANQLYKDRGHGKSWKNVMEELGFAPERCHTLAFAPAKKTRTYRYQCNCRIFELSSVRHNRIQKREKSYRCNCCDHVLVLADR